MSKVVAKKGSMNPFKVIGRFFRIIDNFLMGAETASEAFATSTESLVTIAENFNKKQQAKAKYSAEAVAEAIAKAELEATPKDKAVTLDLNV